VTGLAASTFGLTRKKIKMHYVKDF
jgi:hypothetical protein